MEFNIQDNMLISCRMEADDGDTVVIPEGVVGIAANVFKNNTEIKRVILPQTLIVIGQEAFADCNRLEEIRLPDSVRDIGCGAFYGCHSIDELTLPRGLVEVRDFSFANCGIRELNLPDTLETIGNSAFAYNPLREITLPDSVKTLARCAFAKCQKLERVVLPKGLKAIGEMCFTDCWMLYEAVISEGTEIIGECAFYHSGIRNITLPKSLKKIGGFAFGLTLLNEIEIPDGVEEIESVAFYNTNIKEITLPDSVVKFGGDFADSTVKITISENHPAFVQKDGYIISRDGKTLHRSADRIEATVPDGVEIICSNAFNRCRSLERVVMPPSVTVIGELAFCGCSKLKEIVLSPNIRRIERNAFLSAGINKITLPDSLEALSDAFSNCQMERLVVPPNTVITDDFFFRHGLEYINSLTINVAADGFPQDAYDNNRNRSITLKIIRGYAEGANEGYPFSAEVIARNNSIINGMGTAQLMDFSEDFIYFTIKVGALNIESAEGLLKLNAEISLSLQSALAEYTARTDGPVDRFRL
ncbi:MAG: leucine-rich repeat domain-containing protein [Oscillospiraceae bacterium]